MQKNFATGVTFSLQFEGGFVNDPHDPGGATNKGITLATYRTAVGPSAGIPELRALSTAAAAAIYHCHYWTTINTDALPGGVDVLAFDIAVNMGVGRARQFLAQTAKLAPAAQVQTLHNLRMGWWKRLATWARFGKGWTAREVACRQILWPTGSSLSEDVSGKFNMNLGTQGYLVLINPITSTAAAVGGATALPATPGGYWSIIIGGSVRKIPYYN